MRVVLTNSYAQNMKLSIINSSCFNMHYILIDYHLFFNHEKLAAAVLLVDFLPISDGGVSSFIVQNVEINVMLPANIYVIILLNGT
jgi:hypothetical protein